MMQKKKSPHDHPRRISLRPSGARHGRKRGSARCQMQKLSAGKVQFEPPFKSFDHYVGGYEQLIGHGEAEHSRSLSVDDQFEFARLQDRQVGRFRAL